MADPLSLKQLKALPVADYATIRPNLKSGDLLFCSGTYLVSKLIQEMTDSPWSHVGIILVSKEIDRVLLLESVEDVGVRIAPLSKYLVDYENDKPYKGPLVLARCSEMTGPKVKAVAEFGTDELTRPYDKEDIGRIVARIALGLGHKKKDREYICSELVAECFAAGEIEITGDGGYVTPEDVWQHNSVKIIDRIL